jgi:hypothetical protein
VTERLDRILDVIDTGLQTPVPDPTHGERSPRNRPGCVRCDGHVAEGTDLCGGCRAFLLDDSDTDPAELPNNPQSAFWSFEIRDGMWQQSTLGAIPPLPPLPDLRDMWHLVQHLRRLGSHEPIYVTGEERDSIMRDPNVAQATGPGRFAESWDLASLTFFGRRLAVDPQRAAEQRARWRTER